MVWYAEWFIGWIIDQRWAAFCLAGRRQIHHLWRGPQHRSPGWKSRQENNVSEHTRWVYHRKTLLSSSLFSMTAPRRVTAASSRGPHSFYYLRGLRRPQKITRCVLPIPVLEFSYGHNWLNLSSARKPWKYEKHFSEAGYKRLKILSHISKKKQS